MKNFTITPACSSSYNWGGYTWVLCWPNISDEEIEEVNKWLDYQSIEYYNVVARYWFKRRADVDWFLLRWS